MKIKREVNGVQMEFALTQDEIAEAYLVHEHYYDCESVRSDLNSGCYEEFEGLSDDEREAAVHEIAYEARRQQDKYGLGEWDAMDVARKWYVVNHKLGDSQNDVDEVSNGRYEIEVTIDGVGGPEEELCIKMAGNDLEELKAGILPAVQKACAEQGYLDNQVVVGILIEENGEWLDSDEETFDLSELNVWICSYKDSLGYIDNDNVTEILVPKAWLLEKLKAEGETDFDGWYDEHTADNTDMIARFAVSEGVVLSCADKRISCVLGLGESFLRINDYGKRLAEHIREIYKAEYNKGEYLHEGTDIISDIFVSTPENAAGWCLLTYGDRALGEVQEWIGEREAAGFGETTVFGFDIYDVRNILDKCVVPVKDSTLEVRLADASQRSCEGRGDLVAGVMDDMCK